MSLTSINPTNDELIAEYPAHEPEQVSEIIAGVHRAYLDCQRLSLAVRACLLQSAARVLRENRNQYAELMTLEMGKPIVQARAEVEKCAWVCDYYAENGARFLADETVATDATRSFVTFQPLGVVLAVMPWNFPFWQVFRFAAPALMAGNTALLKHSSNVSGCALAIESVFREAGFPENVLRTLLIPSSQVEAVIAHPLVKAVTLTGSTPAGRAVAAAAGRTLKKTVLELGGSDPYLILEDADLEAAAATCANARIVNGGQSCIAAKRFIIVEDVYPQFEALFLAEMKRKRMGDPFDETIDLGPQARTDLRNELHDQVQRSLAQGARLLLGGAIPKQKGAWYPPTVLAGVTKGMPAFDEELFGPVAPLIRARDEADGIRLANESVFGLGAAIFTRDLERGVSIARERLNAGACFVNTFVRSDPRLPFGGINESGYGRELSVFGIREFVNIKSVYVA
jgi:succinate-semialdehyde dehydrogenase / glutarate-semialdehyde dehydrogenase